MELEVVEMMAMLMITIAICAMSMIAIVGFAHLTIKSIGLSSKIISEEKTEEIKKIVFG